jgi:tetratricopeptide (TPR) repeat protein
MGDGLASAGEGTEWISVAFDPGVVRFGRVIGREDRSLVGEFSKLQRQTLDEGSALYDRVERLRQSSLGPKHPETIGIGYFRGVQLIEHGDAEKGRQGIQSTLDTLRSNGLANHEYAAQCLNGLGWAALKDKDLDEAEARFREALEVFAKAGLDHDVEKPGQVLQNLSLVADALIEDGDPDKAEELLKFVQEGFTQLLGRSSSDAINQRVKRFEILCTRKRLDDALALAAETEPLLDLKNHQHLAVLVELRVNVARLHADRGEKDEAARILRSTIDLVGTKDSLAVPVQRLLDGLAVGADETRGAVPSAGHR